MKAKEYYFDVEMIKDYTYLVCNIPQNISIHFMERGVSLERLIQILNENKSEENVKITFNIRGVNY